MEAAIAGPDGVSVIAAPTLAWRDETVAVLRENAAPMHYRELYRVISARGFTFGGRSPEATFLASLSRKQAVFAGVGKGNYWIAGEPMPPAEADRHA